MRKLSLTLKVIAIIIGVFFIPYGLLGFFGINPAGRHEELWMKLVGLYMTILGALYLYPNSKLVKLKFKQTLYYVITLSPIVVVIAAALMTIYKENMESFVIQGGIATVVGTTLCALFAPLSLFFHRKNNKLTSDIVN